MELQNTMYDVELVLGTILPVLIAVFIQPHWRPGVRSLAALLLCFATALVLQWQGWTQTPTVESFIAITLTAFTWYKAVWVPTGIAPAVENATALHVER